MANNKVIDKVGNTLLDLTEDDVTAADVISGKKFHGRDGVQKTGTLEFVKVNKTITNNGMYNSIDDNADGYGIVNVNVSLPTDDVFVDIWESYKTAHLFSWRRAFSSGNDSTVESLDGAASYLTNSALQKISFSGSENITDMTDMFMGCRKITEVPLFDTSNCTVMSTMFKYCSSLVSVPSFDTRKVTKFNYMFGYCTSLVSVPSFDMSSLDPNYDHSISQMFTHCTSLKTAPFFDTSKVKGFIQLFSECSSLESVPQYDTSNVQYMTQVFDGCSSLKEVPAWNCEKVTVDLGFNKIFNGCSSITSILMYNIKTNLDISPTALGHDALVTLIGNLATVSSTKKLTMGSSKLALLSNDEKAVATNKGWTLA